MTTSFEHPMIAVITIASVVMFLASVLITPWLLVRIPADYFKQNKPHLLERIRGARWTQASGLILKNLVGAVLVIAGVLMLVLPGQGMLTILIGVLLVDFPGKFRLERTLIQQKKVYDSIDWLRRKYGKPPLEL